MERAEIINQRSARVQSALEGAFGVRAKTLAKALRKTGRRMPKRLRVEAGLIAQAEALGGNPKLLRQVDGVALARAEAAVVTWLDGVDRADQRRGFWIWVGAMVGFNMIAVIAGVVTWMWWTDRI
ncbi:MAG: hypothetical protein AAF252_08985 [Pseudomonadota bacterium]